VIWIVIAALAILALAVARALARARRRVGAVSEPGWRETAAGARIESLSLGGRRFDVMTTGPIRWDAYVMRSLTRAGLIPLPDLAASETHGEYAARLLVELLSRGEFPTLCGGLLVPSGVGALGWTPEHAAATADHIGALVAPEDKRKLHNIAVCVLLDFFEHGTASSLISLNSSSATAEIGPRRTTAATANGQASSPTSRTATPTAGPSWPAGISETRSKRS
jgi:hypothetical protein